MLVHLINFVIWSVLAVLQTVFSIAVINIENRVDPNVPTEEELKYF